MKIERQNGGNRIGGGAAPGLRGAGRRRAFLRLLRARPRRIANKRRQQSSPPGGGNPVLQHTTLPAPRPEVPGSAPVVVADTQDWTGQLAGELRKLAALACERPLGPIQVTFHGGRLEGVVGQVVVTEGRVRCRLRAGAADTRRRLTAAEARLAGRLRSGGLRLESLEVLP